MADNGKKKGAAIIPLRREGTAASQSLPARLSQLREKPPKDQFALLIGDVDGKRLTRSLEPQELYWLIKELGEHEALPLITFSSPEQGRFFLDMELWEQWSYSREKALAWLSHLVDAGEERLVEQLPHLDFELLLLICLKELHVGGGIGDMLSEEERASDWDHTFDDIFFITFRDEKQAQLLGRLLDIIYRNDHDLYLRLMEATKSEIESEVEELCYRFRAGRLADQGFPERDVALFIYGYLEPDTFVPSGDKAPDIFETETLLPVPVLSGNSLLQRAMSLADSEWLGQEFNFLINTALVAEDAPFADRDAMDAVLNRVKGYLNIALEWLSGGDEKEAARILEDEYLKRLFQLGYSILVRLRRRAEELAPEASDHATNRALLGLRRKCPHFYRGLDPDCVDGYREFQDMADVRAVDGLLNALGG